MKLYLVLLLLFWGEFACGQIITTIAGNGISGGGGDSVLATIAEIAQPDGIAVDEHNNIIIAERLYNKIRRVDGMTNIITTIVGTGVSGFYGDGGPADNCELSNCIYVSCGKNGSLYISDNGNRRIRVVDTLGIISTYAGTGASGDSGDYGAATSATFQSVTGTSIDTFGNLYIPDVVSNRIRKITYATGIITTVAGIGTPGFSGDGSVATAAAINGCQGLATDRAGNIYLADRNNFRIRKIDITTGIINTIAGTGGSAAYTMDSIPATDAPMDPWYIGIDNSNNIYVADFYNYRIRKIDALTGLIYTVVGNGTAGFMGDGGPAESAEINGTGTIVFDKCGNLYFPDVYNNRVRKVTIPQSPPTITITASDDSFCAGNSVTLLSSYTASVPGTAGYQWIVNSSPVSGATNSSYNYNPASGDSVRCVLTFTSNCGGAVVSSNTLNMTLVSSITPTIALPTGIFYASAGTVITVNAALADTPISYLINWFNKGVWFAGTTTPWVTYTKTMAIDSITAHIAPSGFCYDSAVSGVEVVIDSVLGVQSMAIGTGVRLYPNPAHDFLELETNGNCYQWQIMDLLGKAITQGDVKGIRTEINIERLPVGVYVIRIDGIVAGRFVKLSEP